MTHLDVRNSMWVDWKMYMREHIRDHPNYVHAIL